MKDRRRRHGALSWMSFFWFTTLFLAFSSALLTTLRRFHPHSPSRPTPSITVRDTVLLPDHALVFLDYPPPLPLHAPHDINCAYSSPNSSLSYLPPLRIERPHPRQQMVRCPLGPNVSLSLSLRSKPYFRPNHRWHSLVYDALFDHRDNTTLLFLKGFNLRPSRESDPSSFLCLFFLRSHLTLPSPAISVAQEIIRCETPPSLLSSHPHSLTVSVRALGGGNPLPTIAMPALHPRPPTPPNKPHTICVCTMLRNQARFLHEWIVYHSAIGVQRWFLYDNNSDDDILHVLHLLRSAGHNISRHVWPWIKTQEAGFAHCALRARDVCEWVAFIDVDEFFHLKTGETTLAQAIARETRGIDNVGEIRTDCYSFGPSGLDEMPREGVMVGYTCRIAGRERHKSIVRPEALNRNLINVVHHFQLKDGYAWVDVNGSTMVINHYKYQVWDVFKDKFQRRVSAYVVDWKTEENQGSKDRVPGLGNSAVQPPDWSNRFCEVWDRGLRNRVVREFMDPVTRLLPWQPKEDMRRTPSGGRKAGRMVTWR